MLKRCKGKTKKGARCKLNTNTDMDQADPLRNGEDFCEYHSWQHGKHIAFDDSQSQPPSPSPPPFVPQNFNVYSTVYSSGWQNNSSVSVLPTTTTPLALPHLAAQSIQIQPFPAPPVVHIQTSNVPICVNPNLKQRIQTVNLNLGFDLKQNEINSLVQMMSYDKRVITNNNLAERILDYKNNPHIHASNVNQNSLATIPNVQPLLHNVNKNKYAKFAIPCPNQPPNVNNGNQNMTNRFKHRFNKKSTEKPSFNATGKPSPSMTKKFGAAAKSSVKGTTKPSFYAAEKPSSKSSNEAKPKFKNQFNNNKKKKGNSTTFIRRKPFQKKSFSAKKPIFKKKKMKINNSQQVQFGANTSPRFSSKKYTKKETTIFTQKNVKKKFGKQSKQEPQTPCPRKKINPTTSKKITFGSQRKSQKKLFGIKAKPNQITLTQMIKNSPKFKPVQKFGKKKQE